MQDVSSYEENSMAKMLPAHSPPIDLRNRGQFLHVLPDIRRGEILPPYQWLEQPSIVTMKGAMWETRAADEENGAETPDAPSVD